MAQYQYNKNDKAQNLAIRPGNVAELLSSLVV